MWLFSGSPAILGDREEDAVADDGTSDFNYTSENQNEKQKIAERMLSWHMAYGRGEDVSAPNYDKEVSHNHIPLLTSGQEVGQYTFGKLLSFFIRNLFWKLPFANCQFVGFRRTVGRFTRAPFDGISWSWCWKACASSFLWIRC